MKKAQYLVVGILLIIIFLFSVGIELSGDSMGLWLYTILPLLNGLVFLIIYFKKIELNKFLKIGYFITLFSVVLFFLGAISTIQRCTPSPSQMGCIFPIIIALMLLSCFSLVSIILITPSLVKKR